MLAKGIVDAPRIHGTLGNSSVHFPGFFFTFFSLKRRHWAY
jgi:hypothetical protein